MKYALRCLEVNADNKLQPLSLGTFNKTVPSQILPLNLQSKSVTQLKRCLSQSLKPRVLDIPLPPNYSDEHQVRVAVLFSGGLDCTVLARMTHDLLPTDQYIDLINVAFENPRVVQAAKNVMKSKKVVVDEEQGPVASPLDCPYEMCPDRETGRKAFAELQEVCPKRKWRFIAVSAPLLGRTPTLTTTRLTYLISKHWATVKV